MSEQLDLLAVGDVMLDLSLPAPRRGERVHAAVALRVAGSAMNAARAAVRLGARAGVAGRVGDDAAGQLVAQELARLGVEAFLALDARAQTGSVALVGEDVVASRGANAAFAASDVPAVTSRATLVSGYLLLHADSGPGAAAALARSGLVGVDLASTALVRGGGSARFASADVLVGNEDAIVAAGEAPLDDALRTLAHGRRLACATLGARGAVACAGGELLRAEPPRVADGNPTGAGDAFAAALLLALLDDATPAAALAHACAAAL